MKRIAYVIHPMAGNVEINRAKAMGYAARIKQLCPDWIVVVPQVLMPFETEKDRIPILNLQIQILVCCDVVVMCGPVCSSGCNDELDTAAANLMEEFKLRSLEEYPDWAMLEGIK